MIIIMDRFISKSLKLWTLLAATMNLLLMVAVANDGSVVNGSVTNHSSSARPDLKSHATILPSTLTTFTDPRRATLSTAANPGTGNPELFSVSASVVLASTPVSSFNRTSSSSLASSQTPLLYSYLVKSNRTQIQEIQGPRQISPISLENPYNSRLGHGPPSASLVTSIHHTNNVDSSEASGDNFLTENSTTVTAQLKSNALLSCFVKNSGDGVTVSWIRRKDYHLLTVGLQTYSSDDRFQAIHSQSPDDWTLKIKYVQARDAGIYECQVSTHPPQSIFVTLNVIEAHAEIAGGPDKFIKSGSTLRLICELKQSTEEPLYVFWYQGLKMINYDQSRNIEVTHDRYSSTLVIYNVEKSDSGNYSCSPSNASPASIFVHIINGENPAAMQHGSHSTVCVPSPPLWCLSLILSLTLQQLYFHYLNNYHCSSYHAAAAAHHGDEGRPANKSRSSSDCRARSNCGDNIVHHITPSSSSSSSSVEPPECHNKSSSCSNFINDDDNLTLFSSSTTCTTRRWFRR